MALNTPKTPIEFHEVTYRLENDKILDVVQYNQLPTRNIHENLMGILSNSGKSVKLSSNSELKFDVVRFRINRLKNAMSILLGSQEMEDSETVVFTKNGQLHKPKTYKKMKIISCYEINNFKDPEKNKYIDVQKFYELDFQNESHKTSWNRESKFRDYWVEKAPNNNNTQQFISQYRALLVE